MSSKVNNKIPHTRVNSIGTSLHRHRLKWQSSVTRHCLLRHFGSGRRKAGSRMETRARIGTLLLLLLQSRVLANTDSRITDGCSPQVAVDHKGANLASVTESSISSKGVYVSGCWSSPAAGTVFRFPEDEI